MTAIHELVDRVSIVVPVYRANATLDALFDALTHDLPKFLKEFEVICIDDGSSDGSWEKITEQAAKDQRFKGLKLSRNFGQHNALLAGIRVARYPVTVTIDDDLQHPPQLIPQLLAKIADGNDVVYGLPIKGEHSLLRVLASRISNWAILSSIRGNRPNIESFSAFRAFKTRLRDGFSSYCGRGVSIDVLLTWAASNYAAVNVAFAPRFAGTSNYTLRKLLSHALTMLTSFSSAPLRFASSVGVLMAAFGFCLLVYVAVLRVALGSAVPGFAFLASVICLFAGAQLLALGLIGEYIAQIHFRSMQQPTYLVARSTDSSNRDD